jgi:acyl-CoA dehydrogenase
VLSGTALALAAEHAEAHALLEQIATGSIVLALAAEESPLHRPTNITATARRQGAGYVFNGSKRFVVDGHVADKLLVVARTSGAVDDAAGISLFIVAADARGVSRRRLSMADSRNSADIDLDNVEVGAGAMIGAEGAAGPLLEQVYDRTRILLAAEMFGMAQELFETTLAYRSNGHSSACSSVRSRL